MLSILTNNRKIRRLVTHAQSGNVAAVTHEAHLTSNVKRNLTSKISEMFAANRLISTIIRTYPRYLLSTPRLTPIVPQAPRLFSTLLTTTNKPLVPSTQLLKNAEITKISNDITRTVTKFSLKKGRRKTVKAVIKRFYRLNWGGWIRTMAGRHKHLWQKSKRRKMRLRRHVFCNGHQSYMLDKMVNAYWRKPKYYVDDPYAPYHNRDWFNYSYSKPKPYFPKVENPV